MAIIGCCCDKVGISFLSNDVEGFFLILCHEILDVSRWRNGMGWDGMGFLLPSYLVPARKVQGSNKVSKALWFPFLCFSLLCCSFLVPLLSLPFSPSLPDLPLPLNEKPRINFRKCQIKNKTKIKFYVLFFSTFMFDVICSMENFSIFIFHSFSFFERRAGGKGIP